MRLETEDALIRGALAVLRLEPSYTPMEALQVWAQGQGMRRAAWTTLTDAQREALARRVAQSLDTTTTPTDSPESA